MTLLSAPFWEIKGGAVSSSPGIVMADGRMLDPYITIVQYVHIKFL